jgi:hypothetical protein
MATRMPSQVSSTLPFCRFSGVARWLHCEKSAAAAALLAEGAALAVWVECGEVLAEAAPGSAEITALGPDLRTAMRSSLSRSGLGGWIKQQSAEEQSGDKITAAHGDSRAIAAAAGRRAASV